MDTGLGGWDHRRIAEEGKSAEIERAVLGEGAAIENPSPVFFGSHFAGTCSNPGDSL